MRHFLLILVLLASACRDNPPISYPTVAKVDETKLPLGPGDKLNLTVYYGARNFTAPYVLDASGKMSVQFIGEVSVIGRTVGEIRGEIQNRLADGYLNEPIVQLTIVELNSLTLSVTGMVLKSGLVKFAPGMTIVDVVAQSGGFTPMARKNMVRVTRMVGGNKQTYTLPVERMQEGDRPSFQMLPGDEVFVPERSW